MLLMRSLIMGYIFLESLFWETRIPSPSYWPELTSLVDRLPYCRAPTSIDLVTLVEVHVDHSSNAFCYYQTRSIINYKF